MMAVLALALLPVASLHAQSARWAVTLQPTQNPQPIGSCSAVWLTIFDSTTKDIPRKSNGQRVSMPDFDLTVTSPDGMSAAGQYNGASNFTLCGCQGAAVGTVATVTATYPAHALAPALH